MKKLPDADRAIQMLKELVKDEPLYWFCHGLGLDFKTTQAWIAAPSKLTKVDIALIKMMHKFPHLIDVANNNFSLDGLDEDSKNYKDFKFKIRILT